MCVMSTVNTSTMKNDTYNTVHTRCSVFIDFVSPRSPWIRESLRRFVEWIGTGRRGCIPVNTLRKNDVITESSQLTYTIIRTCTLELAPSCITWHHMIYAKRMVLVADVASLMNSTENLKVMSTSLTSLSLQLFSCHFQINKMARLPNRTTGGHQNISLCIKERHLFNTSTYRTG